MVRIRFPPAVSLLRTWPSGAHPIDDRRAISPTPAFLASARSVSLFTRTVAFVLAGNMAVAYFMVHAPRGFFPLLNGGELAIVYCFVFSIFGWPGAANGASIECARVRRIP